jgi:hypothetical protein
MEYEPEGFLEVAGDVLGVPSGQVEEDLKRFRDFIEQTGKETGGWRGRIGESPNSTAAAIRQEGAQAQSVEAVNERTDREIAPAEAEIETDRIRGRSVGTCRRTQAPRRRTVSRTIRNGTSQRRN